MTQASAIIADARTLLNDSGSVRWSDADLLQYLNGAARQIAMMLPESAAVEATHTLADTNPRQTIPADGFQFLRVTNNQEANNRSKPVTYVERDVLDQLQPDWYDAVSGTGKPYKHYMFDEREPLAFYLYPRPVASEIVYIMYAKTPTTMTVVGDSWPLPDVYINAAIDYVVYRALTREGRYSLPAETVDRLWNAFTDSLGVRRTTMKEVSPKPNNVPPEAD